MSSPHSWTGTYVPLVCIQQYLKQLPSMKLQLFITYTHDRVSESYSTLLKVFLKVPA